MKTTNVDALMHEVKAPQMPYAKGGPRTLAKFLRYSTGLKKTDNADGIFRISENLEYHRSMVVVLGNGSGIGTYIQGFDILVYGDSIHLTQPPLANQSGPG
jgi:hypothetical protein